MPTGCPAHPDQLLLTCDAYSNSAVRLHSPVIALELPKLLTGEGGIMQSHALKLKA